MSTNDEVIPGLSGMYDTQYKQTVESLCNAWKKYDRFPDALDQSLMEHIAHATALSKISLGQLVRVEEMLATLSIALEELNKKTPPVSTRNDKDR